MITTDDLRFFLSLAATRSLAEAARMMDVTPPAVTQRLHALEKRLGVRLVNRSGRGTALTDEGRLLALRAEQICAELGDLADELAGRRGVVAGHLRVVAPLGFGIAPAIVVITFYAALPILRNAVVGLAGVPDTVVESARGIGMSRLSTLLRVELPMAWPVILTGMRVSGQMVMGVAAIAAWVLGPGLGGFIFSGLSRLGGANALASVLTGVIAVIVVAFILDLLLALLGRLTTSRGLRV